MEWYTVYLFIRCTFKFKYLVNDTFVDMKLTEIPVAVVFAVFVATIILFIALVMMFFRKSVIEMRGSQFEGKYKPWKAITKEGYVTIAVCLTVMGMPADDIMLRHIVISPFGWSCDMSFLVDTKLNFKQYITILSFTCIK